jgi:DNA-directed RNA polymerase specialized sigma24 family protein
MSGQPLEVDESAMLELIDPDPAVAESLLRKLLLDVTRWLEWQRCRDPEGVAAESVHRALKKLTEGATLGDAGFRGYAFGIAKRVLMEWKKRDGRERQLEPDVWELVASTVRDDQRAEARLMLQQALQLLGEEKRQLLIRYCTEDDHTAQCRELNVTPVYLRVMVHRIHEELKVKALPERERDVPRKRPRPGPAPTD